MTEEIVLSAEITAIRAVLAAQRERNDGNESAPSAYADDADWLNAFGARRKGAAEIEAWYRRLFSSPAFPSAQMTMTPSDIRSPVSCDGEGIREMDDRLARHHG